MNKILKIISYIIFLIIFFIIFFILKKYIWKKKKSTDKSPNNESSANILNKGSSASDLSGQSLTGHGDTTTSINQKIKNLKKYNVHNFPQDDISYNKIWYDKIPNFNP